MHHIYPPPPRKLSHRLCYCSWLWNLRYGAPKPITWQMTFSFPIRPCCATMYCSSMLFDSTVTSIKKLKIAYNNGLRRLLNLPKYNSASEMFVNLNIPSFSELLRKLVFRFKNRIINLTFETITVHLRLILTYFIIVVCVGVGGVCVSVMYAYFLLLY